MYAIRSYYAVSLGERLLASAQSGGFLSQRMASDFDGVISAMTQLSTFDGTAILVVYDIGKMEEDAATLKRVLQNT